MKVFLNYATEDRDVVIRIQVFLARYGFDTWIEVQRLSGGIDWNRKILDGVAEADRFIACISKTSLSKIGYVKAEIEAALVKQRSMPSKKFIIPVLLERFVNEPEIFNAVQRVSWYEPTGVIDLLQALDAPVVIDSAFIRRAEDLKPSFSTEARELAVAELAKLNHPLCLPLLQELYFQERELQVQLAVVYAITAINTADAYDVLLNFQTYEQKKRTLSPGNRPLLLAITRGLIALLDRGSNRN